MSITILGRGQKVYVLGDSNGSIFENLIITTSRNDGFFVVRTVYVPEFLMRTIVDDAGELHAGLRRLMVDTQIVTSLTNMQPPHRSQHFVDMALAHRERAVGEVPVVNPPVIISVGHMDCSRALMHLGPYVDFELPSVPHGPSEIEAVGATFPVSQHLVRDLLIADLERLERALVIFRDAGFGKVFLLGLRPPTLDDQGFEGFTHVRSQAHLRYKVALLFNSIVRDLCERVGVGFIDIWPLLSIDGVFDERFELDFLHYNRLAADRIMQSAFDSMF